jgi:hypothetical protein
MSEQTDDTDTMSAATPAEWAFGQLMMLLALVTDPEAVRNRIEQLRAAESAVAKAQRQLARERIAATSEMVTAKEEIDREMDVLLKRRVAVEQAEGQLEADKEMIADFKRSANARRYVPLPGGGVQDLGDPWQASVRPQPPEVEMEIEKVPGPANLHRSVPRRRSMRRCMTPTPAKP